MFNVLTHMSRDGTYSYLVQNGVDGGLRGSTSLFITSWCIAGYEEVIQIPKGSVHIDIRELNLSINYLGEKGLKSQTETAWPALCPAIGRV